MEKQQRLPETSQSGKTTPTAQANIMAVTRKKADVEVHLVPEENHPDPILLFYVRGEEEIATIGVRNSTELVGKVIKLDAILEQKEVSVGLTPPDDCEEQLDLASARPDGIEMALPPVRGQIRRASLPEKPPPTQVQALSSQGGCQATDTPVKGASETPDQPEATPVRGINSSVPGADHAREVTDTKQKSRQSPDSTRGPVTTDMPTSGRVPEVLCNTKATDTPVAGTSNVSSTFDEHGVTSTPAVADTSGEVCNTGSIHKATDTPLGGTSPSSRVPVPEAQCRANVTDTPVGDTSSKPLDSKSGHEIRPKVAGVHCTDVKLVEPEVGGRETSASGDQPTLHVVTPGLTLTQQTYLSRDPEVYQVDASSAKSLTSKMDTQGSDAATTMQLQHMTAALAQCQVLEVPGPQTALLAGKDLSLRRLTVTLQPTPNTQPWAKATNTRPLRRQPSA